MPAALEMPAHRTGHVQSGDVSLFYRLIGQGTGTPVIILHGANYYDSLDWINVAASLGQDRPVMARDARGFGESEWSPSKDYSQDAHLADILALADHMVWPQPVIMGHSLGGAMAILYASRFPVRTKGLIIVDHCPGKGGGANAPKGQSVGHKPEIFASALEAAKSTGRDPRFFDDPSERARMECMVRPVEGGVALKRDPDYRNQVPLEPSRWAHRISVDDMWAELARVTCPILLLHATQSDRYNDAALERIESEFPHIELVHVASGHDVAAGAPEALIEAVEPFLARL